MRAKYFYGMLVWYARCMFDESERVLGEGISLEDQVCSKINFTGNKGSRRLGFTKDDYQ